MVKSPPTNHPNASVTNLPAQEPQVSYRDLGFAYLGRHVSQAATRNPPSQVLTCHADRAHSSIRSSKTCAGIGDRHGLQCSTAPNPHRSISSRIPSVQSRRVIRIQRNPAPSRLSVSAHPCAVFFSRPKLPHPTCTSLPLKAKPEPVSISSRKRSIFIPNWQPISFTAATPGNGLPTKPTSPHSPERSISTASICWLSPARGCF